jgi:hypothetical protein
MAWIWPLLKTEKFYHKTVISKECDAIVLTLRHYSGLNLQKLHKISSSLVQCNAKPLILRHAAESLGIMSFLCRPNCSTYELLINL